jgi:hypothetical protein
MQLSEGHGSNLVCKPGSLAGILIYKDALELGGSLHMQMTSFTWIYLLKGSHIEQALAPTRRPCNFASMVAASSCQQQKT